MKKKKINLNYQLKKLFLKKGKLSKVDFLMDKVYFLLIKETGKNSFDVINSAVTNIMPFFLLTNKKMGKRVIIKPFFILSDFSRKSIGFKWILQSTFRKKGVLYKNLCFEIMDAFNNKGSTKNRLADTVASVLQNKSNIKYRW